MRNLVRLLVLIVRNFGRDECLSYAAAIAYWALFSVFPLLILLMGVLGAFIHGLEQREAAIAVLFKLLGGSVGEDLLRSQVDALAHSAGQAGAIALVLALWSASSVFGAVRAGMAAVWGTDSKQPPVLGKALDLGMVLVVAVLVLASLTSTAFLTTVTEFGASLFGKEIGRATRTVIALCSILVPGAISFLAFVLVYRVVPHITVRLRDIWKGALVSAVLFQGVQIGFGVYVAHFANYQRVYGSLGAVIALLTFMYLSAAILLLGAEITKASLAPPWTAEAGPAPAARGSLTSSRSDT